MILPEVSGKVAGDGGGKGMQDLEELGMLLQVLEMKWCPIWQQGPVWEASGRSVVRKKLHILKLKAQTKAQERQLSVG